MVCCEVTLGDDSIDARSTERDPRGYLLVRHLLNAWRSAAGAHARLHHLRDLRTRLVAAAIATAEREGRCHE